jgi:hypothetical protein
MRPVWTWQFAFFSVSFKIGLLRSRGGSRRASDTNTLRLDESGNLRAADPLVAVVRTRQVEPLHPGRRRNVEFLECGT